MIRSSGISTYKIGGKTLQISNQLGKEKSQYGIEGVKGTETS